MTANSQMQIRLHKALPEAAPDGPRIMPVIVPAEAVCIELPDGTTLYGTVTAESAEIDNQVRVVTKTIRVHGVAPRPDLPRMTWPGDTSGPDEEGDTE